MIKPGLNTVVKLWSVIQPASQPDIIHNQLVIFEKRQFMCTLANSKHKTPLHYLYDSITVVQTSGNMNLQHQTDLLTISLEIKAAKVTEKPSTLMIRSDQNDRS